MSPLEHAALDRLPAFGVSGSENGAFEKGGGGAGRVPLRAPIDGTVVKRKVTLGQAVERATDAFEVANLAKVWVLLDLYEKDLRNVERARTSSCARRALRERYSTPGSRT